MESYFDGTSVGIRNGIVTLDHTKWQYRFSMIHHKITLNESHKISAEHLY